MKIPHTTGPIKVLFFSILERHVQTVATTSAEKAKARRQEAKGLVRIDRELDTRILRVGGKPRLVAREIYYVTTLEPKS